MKRKNFPGRKLKRIQRAKARSMSSFFLGASMEEHWSNELAAARSIRSKRARGARA